MSITLVQHQPTQQIVTNLCSMLANKQSALNAHSTRADVTGGRKVSAVTSHETEQRRDTEVQVRAKTRQWVQCRDWALTMETWNTMSTDETRVSRLHHWWSPKL